jgi:hypothetical protein
MPDEPMSPEEANQYGLPVEQFKTAVEAITQLRDEGKILLYFTRRSTLRLIGDAEDIRLALAPGLTGEAAAVRSAEVQNEVQNIVTYVIRYEPLESAARFMERFYFDDDVPRRGKKEKVTDSEKEEFRDLQVAKLKIAAKALVLEEVRERIARLRTSTGPCLEDLDYELIQDRRDSLRQQTVVTPFMRLRLRYTDIRQEQYLPGFFFGGHDQFGAASSFEVECDLSDIDLLIKRLSDAKQRLLKSETIEDEAE